MDPMFQELKQAREAKHLSLSDIADATLINIKHLEQIEQGNTSILPQTYVRAFIREYAGVVGLDPAAVMKRYDEQTAAPPDASTPAQVPKPAPANGFMVSTKNLRWVFIGVAVTGIIVILWASTGREAPPVVQETPFQTVMRENESKLAPAPLPDKPQITVATPAVPADSLTLRAVATDSVWIRLIVDQNPPREYLFRPRSRGSWKARDRFVLTLGNAGAVQFTLNTKSLGALGRNGSVLRDTTLSRETLKPKPQR